MRFAASLSSLASIESSNFARFDSERIAALEHTVRITIVANSVLLRTHGAPCQRDTIKFVVT